MKEYYKICLRHMGEKDNCFLFWRQEGYCRCLEKSKIFLLEENDLKTQNKYNDFYIEKEIVDRLKQNVRLPKYGEKEETYFDLNSFYVLPNITEVRKELGITLLNFENKEDKSFFNCYFPSKLREEFKYKYKENLFLIKEKENYYSYGKEIEAKTRNEALSKVFKSGDLGLSELDLSFLEFKKKVTCTKSREIVFDKYIEL